MALATTIAALLAAFSLLLLQGWHAERQQLVRVRGAVAQVLAFNLSASLVFEDRVGAQLRLESVRNVSGIHSAFVFDKMGRPFAQMGAKPQDALPTPDRALTTPTWRYTAKELEYRVPVLVDHERVGELVLISDLDELWIMLRNYLAVAGLSFTLATAIALVTGLWLARIIIEPVSRLARAMDRVRRSGEFEHKVDKTSEDEVGDLTDAFNDLLGELKRNDRSLREAFVDLTKAKDQAQEASIQKSQFLANMSHEIRTPLNGVLGMAQAMQMDALPPQQAERLSVIRSSGEILLAVLNDILDISKIEAGKLELETVEFDLGSVVESVRAIFAPTAASKGLYLTTSVAESAAGAWCGDPTRLRQIMSNLVSNALKFTSAGGVSVDVGADTQGLHIRVWDTGMGIPPEKLGQLFGKFVQADSSTTRRFGGTGLGLAICRELTALMGGVIEAKSVSGEGACFIVDLPLVRGTATVPVAAAESCPMANLEAGADEHRRPLRILAADDNATNRRVLEALLSPLEVDLTQVENGREAVASWAAGHFDLILMDIQMPEMDGIQATLEIRDEEARRGCPPTPIFALSANAMAHQIQEYLAAGMSGHVAKPIEAAKLYEALGSVALLHQAA
ncbi:MAG TPA: ATP-binding protein [Caulobacteraceae bacterium]|nr:ATP-binding protein [Caulobacteraceae bacterium]